MQGPTIFTTYNVVRLLGNILVLLLVCFGGALAGTSTYVLVLYENIAEVFGRYVFYGCLYAALACGIFAVVLGLFAFYDFTQENRFTAILTVVSSLCLFTVVLILGIILFSYPRAMQDQVLQAMTSTLPEYGQTNHVTKAWDMMQSFLRCCAIYNLGWHAYKNTVWFRTTNLQLHEKDVLLPVTSPFYLSVPESCCYTLLDGLTGYPTDTYRDQNRCQNWQYGPPLYTDGPHNDALYYRGCYPVLIDYMLLHTKHLFGLCIGLCVVLALMFILLVTSKLMKPLRRKKYA
ncbi:hypothetical protein CRM22_000321 [Opisthorchis felineus]|uniref:Tetraspanin n=1 Tax=Opisthorchis felineus TaxID=147828 RepID=A0A4S2MKA3_OPIFE|nr:hypothetical protein CRM22_000321 [Opisthorchis felineus]